MTKREKMAEAYSALDRACPTEIRFLPSFGEPWKFLFAVIMTAQTTDRRVSEVVPVLFDAYPSLDSFAGADPVDVERIIRSVGFGRAKSINLVKCARVLLSEYSGAVPETIDELVKLPGVGRKTANCVAGEIFGAAAVIVDTHFGRLMRRLGFTDSDDAAKVESDVRKLLSPEKQYRFSMCGNWFARFRCKSRRPDCDGCPLRRLCRRHDGG